MLTMAEKSLLGLAIVLSVVCAGFVVLPALSYEVSLVTSPNREIFYIPAGEPFNITCKGTGDNADKFSSLQWLNKKGRVIPDGVPGTQEEEKHSLTLIFTDPKEDESGVYKCLAVYENRQTLQKSVSIIFHGKKPAFDDNFENLTATENSFVEITCTAKGEEPISYEWYNQADDKITKNFTSSIFANGSALVIPTVTFNHSGIYTCLANNSHGLSSKTFQLMVLPSDGNDTTSNETSFRDALILNVTTTSVKFDFDVTGPVQYIEVKYKDSRSSQEKYFKFQFGEDYELKNLIPAGRYSFRFRTSPSLHDQWSILYETILLPETPEVIFQTIDSGTVKLQWLFKYEDRLKNTIDKHEISYSTVQMVGGNSWKPGTCPITIQIPECASSSYTISGLSQNVYYEIQLRAHTAAGYSEPYSQKIFFSK